MTIKIRTTRKTRRLGLVGRAVPCPPRTCLDVLIHRSPLNWEGADLPAHYKPRNPPRTTVLFSRNGRLTYYTQYILVGANPPCQCFATICNCATGLLASEVFRPSSTTQPTPASHHFPVANNHSRPATSHFLPATDDSCPAKNGSLPATSNFMPAKNDCCPASNGSRPASSHCWLAISRFWPAISHCWPAKNH